MGEVILSLTTGLLVVVSTTVVGFVNAGEGVLITP